jgi:hypothetical protein
VPTRRASGRVELRVGSAPPVEDRLAQRLAVGAVGVDHHDHLRRDSAGSRPSAVRGDAGGERVAQGLTARAPARTA